MTEPQLRSFLLDRIAEGYAFPLNPKWVLADPGWFEVYEALLASPQGSEALEAWIPRAGGLRETIASIGNTFPDRFVPLEGADQTTEYKDTALAELELRSFMQLQRARKRVRALHVYRDRG